MIFGFKIFKDPKFLGLKLFLEYLKPAKVALFFLGQRINKNEITLLWGHLALSPEFKMSELIHTLPVNIVTPSTT